MRADIVRGSRVRGLVALAAAASLAFGAAAVQAQEQEAEVVEEAKDFSGSELSPQQKLGFAEDVAFELSGATNRVLGLIEEAQRTNDVLLLNCLNDKLIALRGLLKVAEDSKLNLAEAIARENVDQQEHNYRKVAIADDQSGMIIAEAEACVGDLGYSNSGETVVRLNVEGQGGDGDDEFGTPNESATRPADSSPDT